MDRRKEELEKKRQKLAELRRAREERRALLESQSTQSSSVSVCVPNVPYCACIHPKDDYQTTTTSTTGRDRKAIDDLVALVLGERPSTPNASAAAGSDRSDAGSDFSNSRPASANYSVPGTPISQ